MLVVVILVPALAMAGLAVVLRRRLARLSLMTWLGWLLVGAGLPVLAGQLLSLSFAGSVEAEIARCESAGGAPGRPRRTPCTALPCDPALRSRPRSRDANPPAAPIAAIPRCC